MKIAFADRAAATADPAFVNVPVEKLLSKSYAADRRARIDLARAQMLERRGGARRGRSHHASHRRGRRGNIVASTQTINSLFGARYIVPGTGMIPNNYMFVFTPFPGRAQFGGAGQAGDIVHVAGHRVARWQATLCARLARRIAHFPSVMQALSNLIDHGMSVQEAVEAPRLWTQGFGVEVENAVPSDVLAALRDRGHDVAAVGNIAGGMSAIQFGADGIMTGAACWRADGTPIGLGGGYPNKDAQDLAEVLRRLGFEIDLKLDFDNRALSSALRSFGVRAADADVALVYFAGHGVQVDGNNYLIPTDAKLERVRDLLYEAVPLQLFLGEISQARKLGIMLLDACRDNPFVDRLAESMGAARTSRIGQGLNRIDDTPSGTMVAMATRANVVAEDGTGEHSPYAQALLTQLQVPGLELGLFFRRVRDQVMEMTQGRQEPYTFGSVGATPFYFNPKPPNRSPIVAAAPPLVVLDNAGAVALGIWPQAIPIMIIWSSR